MYLSTMHLICLRVDAPEKHMILKSDLGRKVASAIVEGSMCVWREVFKELQVLLNFSSGHR